MSYIIFNMLRADTAQTAPIEAIKGGKNAKKSSGDNVGDLLVALSDMRVKVRDDAALKLQKLADKDKTSLDDKTKMVDPLIKLLGDINLHIRGLAAETLGILATSKISPDLKSKMIDPLINTLNENRDDDVQSSVVYAFRYLAVSDIPADDRLKVVDQLFSILLDDKRYIYDVQDNAVDALKGFADSDMPLELRTNAISHLNDKLNKVKSDDPSSSKPKKLESIIRELEKKL
jgi:HEAT repeat protein